jgi:hypothetical protein
MNAALGILHTSRSLGVEAEATALSRRLGYFVASVDVTLPALPQSDWQVVDPVPDRIEPCSWGDLLRAADACLEAARTRAAGPSAG